MKKIWWYKYQSQLGYTYWSKLHPNKCADYLITAEKSETEPKK